LSWPSCSRRDCPNWSISCSRWPPAPLARDSGASVSAGPAATTGRSAATSPEGLRFTARRGGRTAIRRGALSGSNRVYRLVPVPQLGRTLGSTMELRVDLQGAQVALGEAPGQLRGGFADGVVTVTRAHVRAQHPAVRGLGEHQVGA